MSAFSGTQLDVMNLRAERNIDQRQGIAGQNVGFRPAHNCLTDLDPAGRYDVALFAVEIGY